MAQIVITIPDNQLNRVINGIASAKGYMAEIRDTVEGTLRPNPESKSAFAKRMLIEFAKECVKSTESLVASKQARNAKILEVETDLGGIN